MYPLKASNRSFLALATLFLLLTAACGDTTQPAPTAIGGTPGTSGRATPTQKQAANSSPFRGELDSTFGTGGKVTTDLGSHNEQINSIALQPDGKIVAAGVAWPKPDEKPKFTLARYDTTGKLDPAFGEGGTVATNLLGETYDYSIAHAMVLQSDGKIVVVGAANNPKVYHQSFAVVRYNADGSLDKGFGTEGKVLTPLNTKIGMGGDDKALAVALQSDGKILAVGTTGGYPTDMGVVRYNADGSLDTGFGTGGLVITDLRYDEVAQAVAVQPDGKILVAGYSGIDQGGSESHDYALVRYNTDGSLDSSFGTGGHVLTDMSEHEDKAQAIVVQPNGKITLGGPATAGVSFCGSRACWIYGLGLAQYNADGSLDKSFGTAGLATTSVGTTPSIISAGNFALARLPDGRLATAGYLGNSDFLLALYTPTGNVITTLGDEGVIQTKFNANTDRAYALAVQPDGKIVAAGTASVDAKDRLNGDFALVRYR